MTLADVLLDVQEASAIEVRGTVPAAVLVPIYNGRGGLHTVLTERRHDLSRHAGEISFPGGRSDADDGTLVFTALREAQEEIGLQPAGVEIVGALTPTPTLASGYAIYPFVGMIEPDQIWLPSAGEVAAVLEFSLEELAAAYERRPVERRGVSVWTDTYSIGQHVVWGATARILADLLERLRRVGAV